MWALPALVSCRQTMEDLAKAGAALVLCITLPRCCGVRAAWWLGCNVQAGYNGRGSGDLCQRRKHTTAEASG